MSASSRINEHTRAIFTNPATLTGTYLTEEELRLMADIAKEHNLFIIGDEVYREFVYGGEKPASPQLEGYETTSSSSTPCPSASAPAAHASAA